ncbi:MAG: long-chain fatty acid--CoA ligase [Acetobacteraceae bacterium]
MPDTLMPWLDHYPEGVDWHAEIPVAPLPSLLAEAGARYGTGCAFDFLGRRTSWAEAARTAGRIAAGLQRLGYGKGDRIGLLLPNCPAYPLMFFGALQAGMTVVNFNPLYTPRELEQQARDSACVAMATLDLAATYPKAAGLLASGAVRQLILCSFADMLPVSKHALFRMLKRGDLASPRRDANHVWLADLTAGSEPPRPVEIDPARDVAVLQYTGGTSGTPKGAMLSHANLYANTIQGVRWFKDTRMGQERMLAALPFFHVFALTTVLLFSVRVGAEIIMLPRFELGQAVRAIARRRPTYMPGVPTMFNAIAAYERRADLTSIRFCISGGAPLPTEVKARFEARTGCVLVEGYGLTETSPCAICNPPGGRNKSGTIGQPMPATTVELRDPDEPSRRVPIGETGEVCIKGPQVMLGYWRRSEETKASTTPDGFFRTGDIGVMDEEGYFSIVDRIKDIILAGGYNIYPRHLEDAIYEHPAVAECTVIGVPDSYRGETAKAFVVLRKGKSLSAPQLLEFLTDHLSPIEMPKQIEFRTTLPRTLIGKLSKKELVAEERAKREAASA